MSDPFKIRVLGGLTPDPGAPLLVQRVVSEPGYLVLVRPASIVVGARLRTLGSARLVGDLLITESVAKTYAIQPWVGGLDLYQIRSRSPEGLPEPVALAIMVQVVSALRVAHQSDVGHGALGPESARLDSDGIVRLVGFRGGEPTHDVQGLRDLVIHLLGVDDGASCSAELGHLLDSWPVELDEVHLRLMDLLPPGPTSLTAGLVPPGLAPTVHPNPLSGQTLDLFAPPRPTAPPKVRVAGIAGLTLLLGLAAGWFMAPSAGVPAPGQVWVQRATEVRVDCEPFVRAGDTVLLDADTSCRVSGTMPDGARLHGEIDGSLIERYRCLPSTGALRCDVP